MINKKKRQSGLTMIEVVVASIILTAIVGMSSYLVWNSSENVASAEAAAKLESDGREVLAMMSTELRQSRRALIRGVNANTIKIIPASIKSLTGPQLGQLVSPITENTDFSAIAFELTDPDNDYDNLPDVKNSTERTYEVRYWWEVDYEEQKLPVDAGNGPNGREPDGDDDTRNGIIDEGVIKKMETWFEADRTTVKKRLVTVVARNVKKLNFRVPSAGTVNGITYGNTRLEITIDFERLDPKFNRINTGHLTNTAQRNLRIFQRQVSTVVEFRN